MSEGIREIYNEGRVTGLSAYELYVRKLLEHDPTATPPTEMAWLASMYGNGNAMILKISSGTTAGVQDFALPSDSVLCGANTILCSVFNGECVWSATSATSYTGALGYWAEAVTSYGGLISNTSESHPDSSNIPYSSDLFDATSDKQNVVNFCKIAEGIVIQQGTWVATESGEPYEDLTNPSFATDTPSAPVVRLYINKDLTSDVKILLLGFMDSEFTASLAGLGGSTNPETNESANGGFLGPAVFPWSSKIIMIYPNLANLYSEDYVRQLPSGDLTSTQVGSYDFSGQTSDVDSTSIIDLSTIDPQTYYTVKYGNSAIPVRVDNADTAKDSINVLSVLEPGMTYDKINAAEESSTPDDKFFPPALYTAKVSASGVQNMVPVDTAAPGTLKIFETATEAYEYPRQVPNTYAIKYDSATNDLVFYDKNSPIDNTSTLNTKLSEEKIESSDTKAVRGVIQSKGDILKTVALSDLSGNNYPVTGTNGTISVTTQDVGIAWATILKALADNKKIDVLGDQLKALRDALPDLNIPGDITCGGSITDGSGVNLDDKYVSKRIVTGVLNGTTITLNDDSFTTTGYYDIYTSKWGTNPKTVTPGNGTVTLTFRSSQSNLTVGVRCYERLS